MKDKKAVIIGAGPAGLTAAYELVMRTDIKPIVIEAGGDIGGISKTVNYKGNRMDIGGHRFSSKSKRVIGRWLDIMPLQGAPARDDMILGRQVSLSDKPDAPDPEKSDRVMLNRKRFSRILFLHKFIGYPIAVNFKTISALGLLRITAIMASYIKARLFPKKEERSLEDFFINRFGRKLYSELFRDYTEKVWGVSCEGLSSEWGAQRVKGISILTVLKQAIFQDSDEASLITRFMYPKLGAGQFWEEVARIVREKGGEIHLKKKAVGFKYENDMIQEIETEDTVNGDRSSLKADYFLSSMAVKDLINAIREDVPCEVRRIADGLRYRNLIIVGMVLKAIRIKDKAAPKGVNGIIPDNWLYIQEKYVKVGRLDIFNNWSPYIVKDENTVWLGCEYFCDDDDELWGKNDCQMINLASDELVKMYFIEKDDILDATVVRMSKAYPVYTGAYANFNTLKNFTDDIKNLFLIGRNGMHRYNNMDHSMLTAMVAVDNIANGVVYKKNIWSINVEKEYHETR